MNECIVHYHGLSTYSTLKSVSEVNQQMISEAKRVREVIRGENHHETQCSSIPHTIDSKLHHLHPECYKRFALILSNTKIMAAFKENVSSTQPSCEGGSSNGGISTRLRRSIESPSTSQHKPAWVYPPDMCQLCGNEAKYDPKLTNSTRHLPSCCTKTAADKIKQYAHVNRPSLYDEIRDLDLIAKQFKYPDLCYDRFRKPIKATDISTNSTNNLKTGFSAVKCYIQTNILQLKQAISIELLQAIYNPDTADCKKIRSKLKSKILHHFGESILFLQPIPDVPEVIVSKDVALDDIYSGDSNAEPLRGKQ